MCVIFMENLVDTIIKLDMAEIENYEFPMDEPFGLEVNYNNVKYEFIIRFASKNTNLLCFGSGYRGQDKNGRWYLPYFARWSWFKYFNESFISYADPIFRIDDSFGIGWYVGDKDQWYLEIIKEILLKLIINQNIRNDNIAFIGSSGGGTASIMLATLIKGSKALVNNNQFYVLNYYQKPPIKKVINFLKNSFNIENEDELLEKIKYRIDVVELFKKCDYVPPITYYVNSESKLDLNNQFFPFVNEIVNLTFFKNDLLVYFYHEILENPHIAMDSSRTINVIREFTKSNLYNDVPNNIFCNNFSVDIIKDLNIKSHIDVYKKDDISLFSKDNNIFINIKKESINPYYEGHKIGQLAGDFKIIDKQTMFIEGIEIKYELSISNNTSYYILDYYFNKNEKDYRIHGIIKSKVCFEFFTSFEESFLTTVLKSLKEIS